MGIYKPKNILIAAALILCSVSSCKKEETQVIQPETSQVTDIDGNIYQTVKIGGQWWMAEDLRVKHYRDGTIINYFQSATDWIMGSPACCLYDNNATSPGLLYNWYAINEKLAPEGWHIPTDEEWKMLERETGMSVEESNKKGWRGTNEGDKLKISGTKGWTFYEGIWATNESGFAASAGGSRKFDGEWGNPALFATGFWWSSTETSHGSTQAVYRYLDYKSSAVFRSSGEKGYGFSIRCVKD